MRRAVRWVRAEVGATAPETRAVLAGLMLVLGAWVGPGPREPGSHEEPPPTLASSEPTAAPVPGGDAYGHAIVTAASDADEVTGPEPVAADED